jgi:hypothetical protein
MSKYILICDEDDDEDGNITFTNKDDVILQLCSWLNMRVIKE